MKFFEHELPIDPLSMKRWGKRIGEVGTEELLVEFAFDNTNYNGNSWDDDCMHRSEVDGWSVPVPAKKLIRFKIRLDFFVGLLIN
jgi:hypothetical protein